MIHMAQQYQTDRLTKFNYGPAINNQIYGQDKAPVVPLENIKQPVMMVVASDDQIADASDNARLREILPNVVEYLLVPDEDHLSLSFSKNMTYFEQVLATMKKYI